MQDIEAYNYTIYNLQEFFQVKPDYVKIPAQPRLSSFASCEDPSTNRLV